MKVYRTRLWAKDCSGLTFVDSIESLIEVIKSLDFDEHVLVEAVNMDEDEWNEIQERSK